MPWIFLLFGMFFAAVAYLSKTEFALFPFLFLSIFIGASAIASWKKLKLLEASHPTTAYEAPLPGVSAAESRTQTDRAAAFEHLRNLATPRQVRFKPVPRIISIAFPISVAAGVYWVNMNSKMPPDARTAEVQLTTRVHSTRRWKLLSSTVPPTPR